MIREWLHGSFDWETKLKNLLNFYSMKLRIMISFLFKDLPSFHPLFISPLSNNWPLYIGYVTNESVSGNLWALIWQF